MNRKDEAIALLTILRAQGLLQGDLSPVQQLGLAILMREDQAQQWDRDFDQFKSALIAGGQFEIFKKLEAQEESDKFNPADWFTPQQQEEIEDWLEKLEGPMEGEQTFDPEEQEVEPFGERGAQDETDLLEPEALLVPERQDRDP